MTRLSRTRADQLAAVLTIGTLLLAFVGVPALLNPPLGMPFLAVDYLERLDESLVPENPAENAWPLYLEVFHELQPGPQAGLADARPGEPGWEPWARHVSANEHLLERLAEAARREAYGMPVNPRHYHQLKRDFFASRGDQVSSREHELLLENLEGVVLHTWHAKTVSLREHLQLGDLLRASSRAAEDRGELEPALEHCTTLLGIGRQLLARPNAIDILVGSALFERAHEEARGLLRRHPDGWDPEALARWSASLLVDAKLPSLEEACAGEWAFQDDTVQWLFSDDGQGDGRLRLDIEGDFLGLAGSSGLAGSLFDRQTIHQHAGRRETRERLTELRAAVLEATENPRTEEHMLRLRASLDERRHALVLSLDPLLLARNLHGRLAELDEEQEKTATAIAMLRYRLDHGSWPRRLALLVPDYLPE